MSRPMFLITFVACSKAHTHPFIDLSVMTCVGAKSAKGLLYFRSIVFFQFTPQEIEETLMLLLFIDTQSDTF